MKNLQLIPGLHRPQLIVKASLYLERETVIRYIQELGYSSCKTTKDYTHPTKKGIEDLKKSFDSLGFKKTIQRCLASRIRRLNITKDKLKGKLAP